jgi:hypothetical protein
MLNLNKFESLSAIYTDKIQFVEKQHALAGAAT